MPQTPSGEATPQRDLRLLMVSMFVDTIGDGLWLAGGALFFNRAAGLPLFEVGVGLTLGGVVGLVSGIELARIADRRSPRNTYFLLTTVQTAAFAGMVFVHHFVLFVVATAIAASMNQGAQATRSAIIRSKGGEQAVRFRSMLQAIGNVGISIGAVLAGLVIARGTHTAYVLLMLGDAASFFLAGLAMWFTRDAPTAARTPGKTARWTALRDVAYVKVAAMDGVVDLELGVSGYLLPLWVVTHTNAPRWFGSVLLLVNTVLVVLLQVRFARGTDRPAGAAASFRRGTWFLASAAAVFAVTGYLGADAAATVLLVAIILHTLGELQHVAGAFGLAYGLAPLHAGSEYQATFSLGMGMSRAFAPAILTFLCLTWGTGGWGVLAVLFLVAGAFAPRLVRQALASSAGATKREPAEETV